ncbi:MAG: AlbA family DNA-binding domain-containing protein [Candidatus Heimdallarchaeaceae archaeon]
MSEESLKEKTKLIFRFLKINLFRGILPLVSGLVFYYTGHFLIDIFWLKLVMMLGGAYLIIHGALFLGLSFVMRKDINILRRISTLEKLKHEAMNGNLEIFRSLDEDEIIDRKRGRISSEKLVKLITAMSNRFGGVIVFGIDDNKELFLIDNLERDVISNQVENICSNSIVPRIKPEPISVPNGEDLAILTIFIPRARTKPIQVKKDKSYFLRVGRSNRRMTQQDIKQFRKMRY